ELLERHRPEAGRRRRRAVSRWAPLRWIHLATAHRDQHRQPEPHIGIVARSSRAAATPSAAAQRAQFAAAAQPRCIPLATIYTVFGPWRVRDGQYQRHSEHALSWLVM